MVSIKELKDLAQNYSILYVEDEEKIRDGITRYLGSFFKTIDTAKNGEDGLNLYKKSLNSDLKYDIVITDINMPVMNGLDMSRKIKEINDSQDILIVSAYADNSMFIDSITIGVSGYIIKPVDFQQINEILYKVVYKLEKFREHELYTKNLEEIIDTKTQEEQKNYEKTLLSLVTMIDKRDTYTGGHSERVAKYSKLIAEAMGYDKEQCELVYQAGILHDIGKITTPDAILLKPGKLNDLEYKIITEHVLMSHQILNKIPMYKKFIDIIISHHERYDGSGYPYGLKGDEIPELARIMVVADAFDAMTTSRIYKARKSINEAINELITLRGTHFHPEVVDVAKGVLRYIDIESGITQLPKSKLEEERFAYFYRDQLTNLYNSNYLDLQLTKNLDSKKYTSICIIFLHNFGDYNSQNGWLNGDKLLIKFSEMLQNKFPDEPLFRIHGDDFVILRDLIEPIFAEDFEVESELFDTKVSLSVQEININEKSIYSLADLEDIIR